MKNVFLSDSKMTLLIAILFSVAIITFVIIGILVE